MLASTLGIEVVEDTKDDFERDERRKEKTDKGPRWQVEDTSIKRIQEQAHRPRRCYFGKWSCETRCSMQQN